MTSRRAFLGLLGAALAAPAIITTPGLLMPVRKLIEPEPWLIHWGPSAYLDIQWSNDDKMWHSTPVEVKPFEAAGSHYVALPPGAQNARYLRLGSGSLYAEGGPNRPLKWSASA